MELLRDRTSFVVCLNDLEALAILNLLRRTGWHAITVVAPYGSSPRLDDAAIATLRDVVVLVEIDSEETERRLATVGRTVHCVRWHRRHSSNQWARIDRGVGRSCLDQVAAAIGVPLGPADQLVDANDRGYIPLLAAAVRRQMNPKDAAETRPTVLDVVWRHRLIELAMFQAVADGHMAEDRFAKDEDGTLSVPPEWMDGARTRLERSVGAVRDAAEKGRLRIFDCGRTKTTEAPELVLLHVARSDLLLTGDQPEGGSVDEFILDAVYSWMIGDRGRSPTDRLNVLILISDTPEEPLSRVLFSGQDDYRETVEQVLQRFPAGDPGANRLDLWSSGHFGVYFKATDTLGIEGEALSRLADTLLDNLLIGNRPVLAWRTSFTQAFRFRNEAGQLLKAELVEALSEGSGKGGLGTPVVFADSQKDYFLPHVRGMLFPDLRPGHATRRILDAGNALATFDIGISDLTLTVSTKGTFPRRDVLNVTGLKLHLFHADTLVLEWTVEESFAPPKKDGAARNGKPPLWRSYLERSIERSVSVAHVVDLNAKLRLCYSAFKAEKWEPIDIISLRWRRRRLGTLHRGAYVSTDQITGWLLPLLALAMGHAKADDPAVDTAIARFGARVSGGPGWLGPHRPGALQCLHGARAHVHTSVALDGNPPTVPAALAALDVLRARLTTVEPYGKAHFYDPDFARAEMERYTYDRFRSVGTLLSATSHSMAFLGFGDYALDTIHAKHMPGSYRRLSLLTQAYHAALLALSQDVELVGRRIEGGDGPGRRGVRVGQGLTQIREVRERILAFTTLLWFERVSSEVQGGELFDLLVRTADIRRELELISTEVERYEQYLAAARSERDAETQQLLAFIGLPLALFAFLVSNSEPAKQAYFPILTSIEALRTRWDLTDLPLLSQPWGFALVVCAVAAAGFLVGVRLLRHWLGGRDLILAIIALAMIGGLILGGTMLPGQAPVMETQGAAKPDHPDPVEQSK